jgi:UDP-N-acetylmuramoyl-tripeptide--D-alanyl-D-alanine ligase
MGIARVVREKLTRQHRFFICEMGAYGPGSIAALTRLAAPDLGVITAIGLAHYERFKAIERVAQAKFELAEAVVQRNGKVIVTEEVLQQPLPRQFAERHPGSVITVGMGQDCRLRIDGMRQHDKGTEVDVTWDGVPYSLRAPLFGEHQARNIAFAFGTACELGVAPEQAVIALASVPQIAHRLEVRNQPGGWTTIDDAYNSNPVGFASGLRLLASLGEGGRRILATPGMVELGTSHDEEHAKIGALAATCVDVLLAVLPERMPTLVAAYKKGNAQGIVVPCVSFADAQSWLGSNLRPGDVVLVENDLPDLYEKKLSL